MDKRKLIPVFIVAIIGAGVIWKLSGRDEKNNSEGKAEEHSETSRAAIRASAPQREGQGSGEALVWIEDDPIGELRLEGQVIDQAQEPVDGAIVAIDSNPPRIVRSEEDGSFAVDNLVGRSYNLTARSTTGVAGPVTARLSESNDPVILVLAPGATVEVTVVSPKDEPVSAATVELRGIDTLTESTDESGVARFSQVPVGRFSAVAWAAGYAKQHTFLGIASGGAVEKVRLKLRAGAPVSGRVVSESGEPIAGARVTYSGASEWSLQADPRRDAAETDDKGEFRFEALPSGSFRFSARAEGYAPGTSDLTTLDGTSETGDVSIRLEPGAVLSGVVVDRGGQSVPVARLRIAPKTEGMVWRGTREAYADDTGRFRVEGLPRKVTEVVAMSEEASSEVIDVDLEIKPHEAEVTIPLEIDGTIAGVVVDTAGEPVEGAQVSAFPDFRRGGGGRGDFRLRGFSRELTDAGGRFEIHGLVEGPYRVSARPPGSQARRGRFGDGVEADVGDLNVEIVLPKDGGIKGVVQLADGSSPGMFTVGTGWRRGTPFSSEDGEFVLRELAPNTYTVTVRGPDFDQKQVQEVEVKEGQITDIGKISVAQGRVIAGRVVDASGRGVAGATVRAGKMILGDGSTSKAAFTPPFARGIKEATTGDDGGFRLRGVQGGDISIVAEHEEYGRSSSERVIGGQSIPDMQLQLAGFGALKGRATVDGKPAEGVIITASSLADPGLMFSVAAGGDGTFSLDRLAPGSYKVSAMLGRGGPMRGTGQTSMSASVSSGETTSIDLAIEKGQVELEVALTDSQGRDMGFTWMTAVKGAIGAKNGRELFLKVGAMGDGFAAQSMSIRGRSATFRGLHAGRYTVCAIPYPTEVEGMADTIDYMEKHGDSMKAFCETKNVAEAPAEQSTEMTVTIPEVIK